MASFPNLRPHRPSDSSEGFRAFRRRLVIAAFVLAASVIAFALTELAAPGNHAMHSTLRHSTGTRVAALPADASATLGWGGSRG
jgi:hypothetical protein